MNFFTFCEDAALTIKLEGKPVHKFFKPEEFMRWGFCVSNEDGALKDQVVDMPIETFLGLAEPIPADDEKRHAPMEVFKRDVLDNKKTDWDIPFLVLKKNEDDIWKVVAHDGRHRGQLLQSLGYNTMPVRLHIPEGIAEDNVLPEIVWCQNDKNVEREKDFYPFPISEKDFGVPYCDIKGDTISVKDGKGKDKTVITLDAKVYPNPADKEETLAMDFQGKAPSPCVEAKANFKKNYVENVAYRKDNVMPASNLMEYYRKQGHTGFID